METFNRKSLPHVTGAYSCGRDGYSALVGWHSSFPLLSGTSCLRHSASRLLGMNQSCVKRISMLSQAYCVSPSLPSTSRMPAVGSLSAVWCCASTERTRCVPSSASKVRRKPLPASSNNMRAGMRLVAVFPLIIRSHCWSKLRQRRVFFCTSGMVAGKRRLPSTLFTRNPSSLPFRPMKHNPSPLLNTSVEATVMLPRFISFTMPTSRPRLLGVSGEAMSVVLPMRK